MRNINYYNAMYSYAINSRGFPERIQVVDVVNVKNDIRIYYVFQNSKIKKFCSAEKIDKYLFQDECACYDCIYELVREKKKKNAGLKFALLDEENNAYIGGDKKDIENWLNNSPDSFAQYVLKIKDAYVFTNIDNAKRIIARFKKKGIEDRKSG